VKKAIDHLGNNFSSRKEMLKAYGINESTFDSRISRGYSLEDALTKEAKPHGAKSTEDHLGNSFKSITEMLKKYGVKTSTFKKRVRDGWPLEEALTKNVRSGKPRKATDHLGNDYSSQREMFEKYGIDKGTFKSRIKKGMQLEEALTKKVRKLPIKEAKDHLGNSYSSHAKMLKAYRISRVEFSSRILKGYSLEDALTKESLLFSASEPAIDHLGSEYPSHSDMAKAYGININTYYLRRHYGYSVEDALSKEVHSPLVRVTADHLGTVYKNLNEMLNKYGITYNLYRRRIIKGWSLEDALTREKYFRPGIRKVKDHLGNAYPSKKAMAERYGITAGIFNRRIKKGYSVKDALTRKRYKRE